MPILDTSVQSLRTDITRTIPVGATATTATAAFGSRWVQISPDVSVNMLWGVAPTAATTDERIPANAIVYKKINLDDNCSAITTTGTATGVIGTVWISEVVE